MNFIIIGLAVWRISSLFVQEDGPYFIFVRFRKMVGIKWNTSGEAYSDNVIGQLFLCVWCLSIWTGLGFFLLYLLFGQWFVWLCWPLALSALACFIQGVVYK